MILTPHGEHSGPQGRGFKSHRCHVLLFVDFYRVSDASRARSRPSRARAIAFAACSVRLRARASASMAPWACLCFAVSMVFCAWDSIKSTQHTCRVSDFVFYLCLGITRHARAMARAPTGGCPRHTHACARSSCVAVVSTTHIVVYTRDAPRWQCVGGVIARQSPSTDGAVVQDI